MARPIDFLQARSAASARRAALLGCLTALTVPVASAAPAAAASLKVKVPARVHRGGVYTITLTGSYLRAELSGRAYLVSLIQFNPSPCKLTAQLENAQVRAIEFYLAPPGSPQRVGAFEPSSPFSRGDRLAASRTGRRRVCAYLYPRFVGANSTVAPIARATGVYRVVS